MKFDDFSVVVDVVVVVVLFGISEMFDSLFGGLGEEFSN